MFLEKNYSKYKKNYLKYIFKSFLILRVEEKNRKKACFLANFTLFGKVKEV